MAQQRQRNPNKKVFLNPKKLSKECVIVAWNDPQYDQLNVGDCVFALFENPDKTFTTIYFGAKIKQLNPLLIDYDEGGVNNQHSNISIRSYADIKTKTGNVRVPTVIRRMHAEHTPQ